MKKLFVCLSVLGIFFGSFARCEDGEDPAPEVQVQKWYEEHMKGASPFRNESQRKFSGISRFDTDLLEKLNSGNWGFDPLFLEDAEIKELRSPVLRMEISPRLWC